MMFGQAGPVKVFVATRPVDFRKGTDGLSLAVQEQLGMEPFSGAVFVFRAKRADRIKLLVWDQTGMVLVHKRLEGAKFVWSAPKAPPRAGPIHHHTDLGIFPPGQGRRAAQTRPLQAVRAGPSLTRRVRCRRPRGADRASHLPVGSPIFRRGTHHE